MATGATRKKKAASVRRRGPWRAMSGLLLGLALLGAVGAGAWKLLSLPVNRVAITGELGHVSRQELTARISGSLSGGFLWLDLDAIREPLESLPWVHRVVVRRQWPDSIEVRVIEQRAIAHWGDGAYLNHAGEVFSPARAEAIAGLPRLSGPAGSQATVMQQYKRVQERLSPLGMRVAVLTMDSRGGLRAELEGGGVLLLGREALDERLDRLAAIHRAQPGSREFARVDLRYSHGAAIAWRKKQES